MPWWGWVIAGVVLLAVEFTVVDAQFYLLFVGVAALLVGLTGLTGIDLPIWAQWVSFAVLSIATLVFFRRKVYDLTRVHGDRITTTPEGEEVVVPSDLPPGETCRVEYRGSTWSAVNKGDVTLLADSRARIVDVDGLTLHIRSLKH